MALTARPRAGQLRTEAPAVAGVIAAKMRKPSMLTAVVVNPS